MSSRPEDERVKIPALVHMTRLGYRYISWAKHKRDEDTNIFIDIFHTALNQVNGTEFGEETVLSLVETIKGVLDNDDLGKDFFKILQKGCDGVKLIDFNHPEKNLWNVATEYTCKNGQDEFRPDITVMINGMPLAFVEVKRPNNKDGIQAERDRMDKRLQNRKFRRFINMTQLMIFSNNSEYDDSEAVPLEGAFYSTIGFKRLFFSHFREEDTSIFTQIAYIDQNEESFILKDNNLVQLKIAPEYPTNLKPTSPTNRILTSMMSQGRILFLLRYGLAYVEKPDDNGIMQLEKHVMRYPQMFATKAIEERIEAGGKKGIIWHTQGSGKTALAYFNVKYLTDYFQKKGVIAKFYFIVDRLDLLQQAADEFRARGLNVNEVNSKDDFKKAISPEGEADTSGKLSITVINIQKFSKESVAKASDYSINVQRVYFLDEAHRSYNPKGSFLSHLQSSDKNAIMIALTGTPLIGEGYNSKEIFGSYIHKYFYNRSIKDGYTLRLIREGIRTEYRILLRNVLENIRTLERSIKREDLYAHEKYVKGLLAYIVEDFKKSRISLGDNTIGGMIVCDSSKQAREVFKQLNDDYDLKAALILHDEDDTETRKQERIDFKKSSIDILVVYNMLLTGFDAPRLKRLYMGRVIRDHSLLQALTRVNRPYGKHRFGYVVDFADIREEFEKTNREYMEELQRELGDAFSEYDSIFMTEEEITAALEEIQNELFLYDTDNISVFTQQISASEDKKELLALRHALESYKELENVARLFGYDELASSFQYENASSLLTEVNNRIAIVNLKKSVSNAEDMSMVLNTAMDEIEFVFKRVSKDEMVIADSFRETLEKTRREMHNSHDPEDPEYVSLLEELQRILQKKNIEELTVEEMNQASSQFERIRAYAERLNNRDAMLTRKYEGDYKYMRIHKRLRNNPPPIGTDSQLFPILIELKHIADNKVMENSGVLRNEAYFTQDMMPVIKQTVTAHGLPITYPQLQFFGATLSQEYFHERAWA